MKSIPFRQTHLHPVRAIGRFGVLEHFGPLGEGDETGQAMRAFSEKYHHHHENPLGLLAPDLKTAVERAIRVGAIEGDHYAGGEASAVQKDVQSDTLGLFFNRGQHYFSVSPSLSGALERTENLLSWKVRDFSVPYDSLYVHFGEEGPALFEDGPGEHFKGERASTDEDLKVDPKLGEGWHLEGAYVFRHYLHAGGHYERYKELVAEGGQIREAWNHLGKADRVPSEAPVPGRVVLVAARDGHGGADYGDGRTPWDFMAHERWIMLSLQEQRMPGESGPQQLGPEATLESAVEAALGQYEQAYAEHSGQADHVDDYAPGWARALDAEEGIWMTGPLRKALGHVMSALMVMSARPEMIRERWPEEAPSALVEKAAEARRRGDTATLERTEGKLQSQGFRRLMLDHASLSGSSGEGSAKGSGLAAPSSQAAGGAETGGAEADEARRAPGSHWRRGHFRTQRFGKGLKKRKVIWIEPVFVGGAEGETPDVQREYRMDERLDTSQSLS